MMERLSIRTLFALGLFGAATASAQEVLEFPLEPAGRDAATGQLLLRSAPETARSLVDRSAVVFREVDLPTGALVDLQLERVPLGALRFGFQVDGRPAPGLLAGLDLSVWKGRVLGDESSDVILSFSNAGTRGWIHSRGETSHLMPQPGDGNDWSRGYSVFTTGRALVELDVNPALACGTEELGLATTFDAIPRGPEESAVEGMSLEPSASLWECSIAVETDYQLNQLFGGDLGAQTAYVTTLLAAASEKYIEEVHTRLVYPYVQFYTDAGDPWTSQDNDGNSVDLLYEFDDAWGLQDLPGDAVLGHFLSGAPLGGGVAYLGVLCDTTKEFTFGVSGSLDGDVPFPIQQGPTNWDFIVLVHELGHNFSTPHTHDYCPPIDECAPEQYWGSCQDEVICLSDGTIMGYCHQCQGGLANVQPFFHPTVKDTMAAHIEGCLPVVAGLSASPPVIVAPDVPTELTVNVIGAAGDVDLHYRFDSGSSYTSVPMSDVGGGNFSADLPAPGCADAPEFFFTATEGTLGQLQTEVFSADVGLQTIEFSDDFETDQGWIVGAFDDDATTGIWTRVNPNGTSAQPSEGYDAGASGPVCFVTGQGSPGGGLGDEDVDGGKTTLISPVIDLAGDDATVSYWRWYSNDTSASPNADIFEVEVTSDGSSWTNVETVGPAGEEASGGWYYHSFVVSDFVAPSATVQVRFIASDEGDGSLVEAAVDDFEVFRFSCVVCQADLGFGSSSATLSFCGPPLSTGNVGSLDIEDAPANAAGLVLYALGANPVPVLGGTLVPNPVLGFVSVLTDGSGQASLPAVGGLGAFTVTLQGLVGDTGGQVVFTNAIEVEFLP